ncbi:MAG: ABC transporter ATP-binding protein [Anaerolineaceae bacterium]
MIITKDLSKVFKIGKKHKEDFVAVDSLSLQVNEGEVFGFLGPNGAGKTTTVRMLTSLIRPTRGQASINGLQLGKDDTQIRRTVGILTESPGMYERLSAEKNLSIFANLYDVPDVNAAVGKYLTMLGLWERRADPVGSFSKGMRQKLAVARALLHEPKVLFLDEPTTGLDPEAAKTVRDFVQELKERGRTIFMTTHNLDEADKLCDRVAIFKQTLLAVDTPENLRQKLFGRKVVFHLAGLNPDWVGLVTASPNVTHVEAVGEKLVVSLADPDRDNPQIVRTLVDAGADIRFIGELKHSLEQVYLEMLHPEEEGRRQ